MKRHETNGSTQTPLFELPDSPRETPEMSVGARAVLHTEKLDRLDNETDKLGSAYLARHRLGLDDEQTPTHTRKALRKGSRSSNLSKVPDADSDHDPNWNITHREPIGPEQAQINKWGADLVRSVPRHMAMAAEAAEAARTQREIRDRDAAVAQSWDDFAKNAGSEDPASEK